jgi:hypothetical protein
MSNQEEKKYPLMRKSVATWLIDNTKLTFKQIGIFCGLHDLEIKSMADGNIDNYIAPKSPIISGQLTQEEISRCEDDPATEIKLIENEDYTRAKNKKLSNYTPLARRGLKFDGISYLLKYYPNITNTQIRKLIGTTSTTIDSIRKKEHWNIKNIKPGDVVLLGLCSQQQLNDVIKDIKESE